MKLSVWFHCFAAGAWETPTAEFLDAAIESGLTQQIDAIHLVLVGPPDRRQLAHEYCASRTAITVEAEANVGWEQLTLEALRLHPDGDAVLYAHTKGAGLVSTWNDQWRHSMFLSLVTEWRECVRLLAEKEAVGCHWLTPAHGPLVTRPYFGGNMWWARADLIQRLASCAMTERYDAEGWLSTGKPTVADRTPGWPSPTTIRREAIAFRSRRTMRSGSGIRVAVFPSDEGACGWYRLRWPAEELQRQGHDVRVFDDFPALYRRGEKGEPDEVVELGDTDFDLAVMQRAYRPNQLKMVKMLQERGIAVALDIDDDMLAVPPEHPLYPRYAPFWEVLRETYRRADLVTVSTPALAKRYGSTGKARVVSNGVPRAYLGLGRTTPRQVPVVGWTGLVMVHVGDLEQVGTAVAEVCASGATFRGIGDRAICEVLGVKGQYQPGSPLTDLSYQRLYADLDIAIVPLRSNRFNAGKSWLKGLEGAALGVPFVASPVPEYVRLHELGAGLLAESPKEWKAQLGHLIASADLRAEMAAKGREVAATLTTEAMQAPLLWDAWTETIASRRVAA